MGFGLRCWRGEGVCGTRRIQKWISRDIILPGGFVGGYACSVLAYPKGVHRHVASVSYIRPCDDMCDITNIEGSCMVKPAPLMVVKSVTEDLV